MTIGDSAKKIPPLGNSRRAQYFEDRVNVLATALREIVELDDPKEASNLARAALAEAEMPYDPKWR
jgi:hypothetical protein